MLLPAHSSLHPLHLHADTNTEAELTPWWIVDLGSDQPLVSLQAWYRVDAIYGSQFAYRMNGAIVEFLQGTDFAVVATVQLPTNLSSLPRPYKVVVVSVSASATPSSTPTPTSTRAGDPFLVLNGSCFRLNVTASPFVYEFQTCPFQISTQRELYGGTWRNGFSLGTYAGSKASSYTQSFIDGTGCTSPDDPRASSLAFDCGENTALTAAAEGPTCRYSLRLTCPQACT